MLSHHIETLLRAVEHFQQDPEVQGLLLGGSVALGFERPESDVDVMIVVSEEDYARRRAAGQTHFFNRELSTYGDGHVDGKYLTLDFVRLVGEKGSEPARFAFQDVQVLFSHVPGLQALVEAAARYPIAGKTERMGRFHAQLEAWHWYSHEALGLGNPYLYGTAAGKLVLFGGRLILAHNEVLYPYHKWFLKVLEGAADKPAGLLDLVWPLYEAPEPAGVRAFYETVRDFKPWPTLGTSWPTQFLLDSELNWLDGPPPVDDL